MTAETRERIERIAEEKAEAFRLWVSLHRRWERGSDCEETLQRLIQQALTQLAEEERREREKLRNLLESAIMDFEKLKPLIGDASTAVADLYREGLKKC